MTDLTTCPECDGEGYIEYFEDVVDRYYEHSTREWVDECEECHGDGEITPERKEEIDGKR